MDQWEYIDVKEIMDKYNSNKSNWLESFLSENYKHINGRENNNVGLNKVHQISIHSYKSLDNDLLITRRKEKSYLLRDPNDASTKYDEIILMGNKREPIDKFIYELKEEFS